MKSGNESCEMYGYFLNDSHKKRDLLHPCWLLPNRFVMNETVKYHKHKGPVAGFALLVSLVQNSFTGSSRITCK